MEESQRATPGMGGLLLRLFFFLLLEIVGLQIFATLLDELFGRLAAGALGTFLAAAVANALTVRVFERGRLEDVGMGWNKAAQRHLALGLGAGAAAAILVSGLMLAGGMASFESSVDSPFSLGKLLFVAVLLLFGAVGEELLFRGYGFQLLMGLAGPWWIVPVSSALFAWAHSGNVSANWLGLVNTGLWGLVLGYAYWKAKNLWLPIGLHFGWNIVLPLFGANLSGFTMGMLGYSLRPRVAAIWSGGDYGPEASVLTTAVALGLMVWLWRLKNGAKKAEENVANEGVN